MSKEIEQIAESEAVEAKAVEDFISAQEIGSFKDLQIFVQAIAEIKIKSKEVEEKRTTITKPIRQGLDEVNELFKPALGFLNVAEATAKSRIKAYVSQCQIEQERILEDFDIDAEPETKNALMKKAEDLEIPKIPGLSIRETWKGEITNPVELLNYLLKNNPQALKINEKVLVEIAKGQDADPEIPGFRAFKERTVVISASKV